MTTSKSALDDLFRKAAQILFDRIKYWLSYLGLDCVRRIRDRSGEESWFDQSGNLRSSIGYAIYTYGRKEIQSAFGVVGSGTEGASEGKKMVDELTGLYSDTFALVVIAAMNYAEFVEAIESKDVLASTEQYAKKVLSKFLNKAIKEAESEIQKLEVAL